MEKLTIGVQDVMTLAETDVFQIDHLTSDGLLNGTGTLVTDCPFLSGNIDPETNILCYGSLPTPYFTITRLGTDSIDLYLSPVDGATGYLVWIDVTLTFSSPQAFYFDEAGPQTITGLIPRKTYGIKCSADLGTTFSPWSNIRTFTPPANASGEIDFSATAISIDTIRVLFPLLNGPVSLRRRPSESDGEWTILGEHLVTSPYLDKMGAGNALVPNVRYDYQWGVTGKDFVETDEAWLTRTFDRLVEAGGIVSAESLLWEIVASETDVLRGIR